MLFRSTCVPDWECSAWLDCFNNFQKRICVDANRCGTDENRPEEIKDCTVPDEVLATGEEDSAGSEGSGLSSLTGFVVARGAGSWIAAVVLVLIVAGLFFYIGMKSRLNK